jgi:hypothetical protein
MTHQKVLWKIEELWNKFYKPVDTVNIDISSNYNENGTSKYYNRFRRVDSFSFKSTKDVVFEDSNGVYLGLKNLQVKKIDNKLVYLFDNHNEMIYSLVEISETSNNRYDVVHIDAHPDDAEFPGEKTNDLNLKNVEKYITHTRISDFFDAISDANTVGEIHRVTHSDNLEFFMPPENPYILSLDIDIFGPEGDFAELKDKVKAIASAWGGAEAVCIATSPGFIGQKFARNIIEIFTAN